MVIYVLIYIRRSQRCVRGNRAIGPVQDGEGALRRDAQGEGEGRPPWTQTPQTSTSRARSTSPKRRDLSLNLKARDSGTHAVPCPPLPRVPLPTPQAPATRELSCPASLPLARCPRSTRTHSSPSQGCSAPCAPSRVQVGSAYPAPYVDLCTGLSGGTTLIPPGHRATESIQSLRQRKAPDQGLPIARGLSTQVRGC
jgi:hypothetical protein